MRKTKNQLHKEKMDAIRAENLEIVKTGVCPQCGNPLKFNNAMAGWWQCVAYATPSFRAPEYRDLPSCSFQCFTE